MDILAFLRQRRSLTQRQLVEDERSGGIVGLVVGSWALHGLAVGAMVDVLRADYSMLAVLWTVLCYAGSILAFMQRPWGSPVQWAVVVRQGCLLLVCQIAWFQGAKYSGAVRVVLAAEAARCMLQASAGGLSTAQMRGIGLVAFACLLLGCTGSGANSPTVEEYEPPSAPHTGFPLVIDKLYGGTQMLWRLLSAFTGNGMVLLLLANVGQSIWLRDVQDTRADGHLEAVSLGVSAALATPLMLYSCYSTPSALPILWMSPPLVAAFVLVAPPYMRTFTEARYEGVPLAQRSSIMAPVATLLFLQCWSDEAGCLYNVPDGFLPDILSFLLICGGQHVMQRDDPIEDLFHSEERDLDGPAAAAQLLSEAAQCFFRAIQQNGFLQCECGAFILLWVLLAFACWSNSLLLITIVGSSLSTAAFRIASLCTELTEGASHPVFTYGYARCGVLVVFTSLLVLMLFLSTIIIEGMARWSMNAVIERAMWCGGVLVIGLKLVTTALFYKNDVALMGKGGAAYNLSLELLEYSLLALVSVGLWQRWSFGHDLDTAAALLTTVLTLLGSGRLCREQLQILCQRVPEELEEPLFNCFQKIRDLKGVSELSEPHFWFDAMNPKTRALLQPCTCMRPHIHESMFADATTLSQSVTLLL